MHCTHLTSYIKEKQHRVLLMLLISYDGRICICAILSLEISECCLQVDPKKKQHLARIPSLYDGGKQLLKTGSYIRCPIKVSHLIHHVVATFLNTTPVHKSYLIMYLQTHHLQLYYMPMNSIIYIYICKN